MKEEKPKGRLFSHLYMDRDNSLRDSETFRRRVGIYCHKQFGSNNMGLGVYLGYELGLSIPQSPYYDFIQFFIKIPIYNFLDALTLIWRYANTNSMTTVNEKRFIVSLADEWLGFVRRALHEENMGYSADDQCGIHFLVDEEFERNRVSLLKSLENPKYAGVRAAFEDAHRHLDSNPPDTKAAVRSMFESIEILARKMVPEAKNLSSHIIDNKLKQLALSVYSADEIAQDTVKQIFEGFSRWVDGLHNYRHGQGKDEPVQPPVDFTIYVLSSGAAYLRWLIEIDAKRKP